MRERPSLVVELRRFELWQAAVLAVAALSVAAMAAWGGLALSRHVDGAGRIAIVAAVLAAISLAVARSLGRGQAGRLAARDAVWTFSFERDGIERIEEGELAVALDLGVFLLLVLTRIHGSNRLARRWLPVQKRGLEADWHALRVAVFAPPRPAAAGAGAPLPE